MTLREEELQEQIQYLKMQIEELTSVAAVPALCGAIGVSPQQAKMLLVLTRRANFMISKETVYRAVFEHENGDGPVWKIMDVALCNLRRVLRRVNAPGRIETLHGQGWKSTPDLTAWVRSIVSPSGEQVAA